MVKANPWARGAVDARGSVGSRIPLHVYRPKDGDDRPGARERVRAGDGGTGDRLAALMESPGDRLSGRRFRRRLLNDLLIHDNALVEKVYNGGQIVELRWHPWVDVDPVLSDDGLTVEAFVVPTRRRAGLWLTPTPIDPADTRVIDRDDVIHLVTSDETSGEAGPVGLSKFSSLHATHALHDAAMRFATAYMDNGIFPTGVVELHAQASPAAAQATTELLSALHSTVENAGRPIAVSGKWNQLMATPEGAKLVELAKYSREEIAAATRVPLPVLGDISSANRSTADSARSQFVRDVIGDDVAVLETELQAQLVLPNRRWASARLFIEGQLGEQLRPDLTELSEVLNRAIGGPWMVANEGRRLMNMPPLDDEHAERLILNPGTPEADDPDDDADDDLDDDADDL